MTYPKFHDPKVFDENGRVQPHPFEPGYPEWAACMRCGGGPSVFPHK